MARRNAGMGVCLCAIALLVVMIIGRPAAAQQAPAPSMDCTTVVISLSDCLGYVTGADKTPPAKCCTELASVVKSSPLCLCLLFNKTFTDEVGVNVTLAQELPAKCKVQTPPTSLCASVGIPAPGPGSSTSPATAPSSAAGTPASPPTASPPILSSSAPTPTAITSPPPTTPAPVGTTAPAGSPPVLQPNVSALAPPPPPPNSAHSIMPQSFGIAASLLFFLNAICILS